MDLSSLITMVTIVFSMLKVKSALLSNQPQPLYGLSINTTSEFNKTTSELRPPHPRIKTTPELRPPQN